jgi:nicotinate phosphoribosyltransferase
VFPDRPTFLIDTYDTVEGVRNAIRSGFRAAAVRLDSGDLDSLSRQVRQILDKAGLHDVGIFASGDLNESKIQKLVTAQTPISAFGVGTELATVADAPSLSVVYKLVEIEMDGQHTGRVKLSSGKHTYPGRKQVFRESGPDGKFSRDVIGLDSESLPGERLLRPVMERGSCIGSGPPLIQIQEHCRSQLSRLPEEMRDLDACERYRVDVSPLLQAEFDVLANSS